MILGGKGHCHILMRCDMHCDVRKLIIQHVDKINIVPGISQIGAN